MRCSGNIKWWSARIECTKEPMHDGYCQGVLGTVVYAWPGPKMRPLKGCWKGGVSDIPYVRDRDTSEDDILRDAGRL